MAGDKPLGNLFVRVSADVANFTKGMTAVEKRSNKTRTALTKFRKEGANIDGVLAGLALGFGFVAVQMFKVGAAAEETADKFKTVFGAASGSVEKFIEDFATMAGLTDVAAQEILATTGQIAQGMGFAQAASAEFSKEIVAVALDLAAFSNVPAEQAARALQSALTGERESLKRLGIVISEVEVKAQALAMRTDGVTGAITNQEKALATLALITEKGGVAIGNLVATQDSAQAVSRQLGAEFGNLKDQLATALLPIMAQLLTTVGESQGTFEFLGKIIEGVALFVRTLVLELQLLGVGLAVVAGKIGVFVAQLSESKLGDAVRLLGRFTIPGILIGKTLDFFGVDFPDSVDDARQALVFLEEEAAKLTEALLLAFAAGGRFADNNDTRLNPSIESIADQVRAATNVIMREMVPAFVTAETVGVMAADNLRFAWETAADAAARMAAATQKAVDIIRESTQASASLFSIWKSNQGFFAKLGATLGLVGGLVSLIPGGQVFGAGIAGAGVLAGQFAHGGMIPAGQVGIVGEAGPELVEGPAAVTPMGGQGGITINIVTESGRQLVDTIRIKDKRDNDMRRVIRVPIAAIATG